MAELLDGKASLTELNLRHNGIEAAGAQRLFQCFFPPGLDLRSSARLSTAFHCARLQLLHLSCPFLHSKLIPGPLASASRSVASHGGLVDLKLAWNAIGNVGASAAGEALLRNRRLKILHLQANGISTDGMKGLARGENCAFLSTLPIRIPLPDLPPSLSLPLSLSVSLSLIAPLHLVPTHQGALRCMFFFLGAA